MAIPDTTLRAVLHVRRDAPIKAHHHPSRSEGACLTIGGENPVTLMFDNAGELAACEKAIRDFVARTLGAEVIAFPTPDNQPEPPRAA